MRIFSNKQFYLRLFAFFAVWFSGCFLGHLLCVQCADFFEFHQISMPYHVTPFTFAATVMPGLLVYFLWHRQWLIAVYGVCLLKAVSISFCFDLVFQSCGDAGFLCICFVLLPQLFLLAPLWYLFMCIAHGDEQTLSGIMLIYFLSAGFLFLIQGAFISPFYLKLFSLL